MTTIDISQCHSCELLVLLFKAAKPALNDKNGESQLTKLEAERYLATHGKIIGTLKGRVIDVDLSGDYFDCTRYDCANDEHGLAAKIVANMRRPKLLPSGVLMRQSDGTVANATCQMMNNHLKPAYL